jgi:quinol-cytochrome oxidoreductase complex cytochrome b subunit
VALMGIAIVVLALLPLVDTSYFRSTYFKPLNLWLFWFFVGTSCCLGWIGQEVVESPFIETANFVTFSYFAYFLVLPTVGFIQNNLLDSQNLIFSILIK